MNLKYQKVEVKGLDKSKAVYADALENLKRLKDEFNRRRETDFTNEQ